MERHTVPRNTAPDNEVEEVNYTQEPLAGCRLLIEGNPDFPSFLSLFDRLRGGLSVDAKQAVFGALMKLLLHTSDGTTYTLHLPTREEALEFKYELSYVEPDDGAILRLALHRDQEPEAEAETENDEPYKGRVIIIAGRSCSGISYYAFAG